MGFIQPGTGYNFVNSEDGASLEILFPEVATLPPEQFQVEMDGDNVRVAKGRVVAQDLTLKPTTALHEFNVLGYSVYPTGKLTNGTNSSSPFCNQGGHVEILKYTPGEGEDPATGSNAWGVYLIRNYDSTGGAYGYTGNPSLAVMADGSDAENFSTPWEGGIDREYITIRSVQTVVIEQPSESVTGALVIAHHCAIKRYQCQRIKIAAINWTDANGWTVTQHLIGSLYMPNNVNVECEIDYEAYDEEGEPTVPPDIDWPLNAAENESWFDAWSGYTKVFDTTITVPIPV